MRKIATLISLLVLLFMVNFGLWFYHTRVVHQALEQLRGEMLRNNFHLSYEDVRFTNFKSWRVEGVLEKLELRYGGGSTTLKIKDVKFQSQPFANEVRLWVHGNIEIYSASASGQEELFHLIPHADMPPALVVNLESSLSGVADALKAPDEPKFHLIDAIVYQDDGFDCYDVIKNAHYFSVGASRLYMRAELDKRGRRFSLDYNMSNLVFDKDYPVDTLMKDTYEGYTSLGAISTHIDFLYTETPSKLLMMLMGRDKENKKKYKGVFDSYQVQLNNLSQTTDLFNVNITGNIDKQPDILLPEVNMVVKLNNYKNFADHTVKSYNAALERLSGVQMSMGSFHKISDADKIKLMRLFAGDAFNEHDVDVTVTNRREEGFVIAGKPLVIFAQELQKVIFDDKKGVK